MPPPHTHTYWTSIASEKSRTRRKYKEWKHRAPKHTLYTPFGFFFFFFLLFDVRPLHLKISGSAYDWYFTFMTLRWHKCARVSGMTGNLPIASCEKIFIKKSIYLFYWKLITNYKTWGTSACHAYLCIKNLLILCSTWKAWNRLWSMQRWFSNIKSTSHECCMTFWNISIYSNTLNR